MKTIKDIPKSFKIANNIIKVRVLEESKEARFGYWDDVTNQIVIYKKIGDDILSDEQILNTFYHELIHCFQFFCGYPREEDFKEIVAQSYGNFIREYQSTVKYK